LRFNLILFFVFLVFYSAWGQDRQIDSLKRLIRTEGETNRKVELLNALSFLHFDGDIEQANQPTEEALELAKKIGDKTGEGWANAYRGLYYFFNGSLSFAKKYFSESLDVGKQIGNTKIQVYSLTQLGNVHRDKGAFDSARLFYNLAEKVSKKNQDLLYSSVIKMNESRYYLITEKPDSALLKANEAVQMRKQLGDSVLLSGSWIVLGNCYRNKFDLEKAVLYYEKARHAAPEDASIQAEYLLGMGEVYFRRGDFESALRNWNQVLVFHRNGHYKYALAFLLLRMGEAFEEEGYYDVAAEYLSNSLKISEKAGYLFLVAETNFELGWVYYRSGSLELSKKNIRQAELTYQRMNLELGISGCLNVRGLILMKESKFDSSYFYHQKCLAVRMRMGNKVGISSSLFNLGELFIAQNKFATALPYFQKGVKLDAEIGDEYGLSLYYNRIGRIYTQLHTFDSANYYLSKSLDIATHHSSIDILRVGYSDMADYFQRTGKLDQSITFYKKFNQLTDSIFNKQTAQSLGAYRALYEVERNERQIELLNKDNELNKAQVQKQKIILYTVIGGAAILLVVAGFYFRFNKRLRKLNESLSEKNKEIAEKNEEIQAQAEELTESNQNLEIRIEARTSELKQAFKELDTFFYRSSHDFRRPLTTFMGLAEVARVLVKDPAALELFEKVNENALNLDKMLSKLQSVSDVDTQTLLYKEIQVKEIFEIELDGLKPDLDRKKIKTVLSVNLEHPFYSYGALIRIILQNLLENSIAFCTEDSPVIHLSAYEKNSEVVFEVKDNGQGIEPEYLDRVFEMYFRANEHSKGNGLGLYIVKKTVQKLNGRVELESSTNKGTTIRVFFPQRLE
jgi:signal transduction histidine kinase